MKSNKSDKSQCLERINSAIYLNNTRGAKGREDRDSECDDLLMKYFYECDYASSKSMAIFLAFSDVTTTLIQAIESYRYGQFDASMVMIRNAIDASTYISIVYDLNYDTSLNRINSVSPRGSVMEYKKFKKWCKRKDEIISKGFLSSEELDKLHEIRDKGNFSAHYFEIKRDKFHEYVEKIAKLAKPQPDLPKQYTLESEIKVDLNAVVTTLMKLHENYVKYYKVPM